MILLDIEQDTPQWHELRRTKIGASDAPIIVGKSPYVTPSQLMEQKIIGKKSFVSSQMRRGKELEPIVRRWYSENRKPVKPIVAKSPIYDWMIASLDGLSEDQKEFIEIKCPNEDTYRMIKRGQVPIHYEWQIQHQMMVTGLSNCTLIAYNGTDNPIDLDVSRSEIMIEELVEAEYVFYQKMINYEYPDDPSSKPIERTDAEAMEIVDAAIKCKDWMDTAKEQYEIVREGAIHLANDISFMCKGVIMRKMLVKGSVDYDKILKEHNIDPEKYRKPGRVQWRWEFPKTEKELSEAL